jgi:hypothetical protein
MSITIKEVLEWTKWRDHGASYPRLLEKSMRSANSLFADLAISQNEELETLRVQLAEKDAMLEKCGSAIVAMAEDGWLLFGKEGMSEAQDKCYAAYRIVKPDDKQSTTTTQDVIAKARNEAEDAKRYRWVRENWAYSDHTIFFSSFNLGPFATLDDAIDSALKTEEK